MSERPVTRLKPDGQAARLLRWLRANPGASSLEITEALRLVNVTGRISDLRKVGYRVECRRDPVKKVDRYYVIEPQPEPVRGQQLGLAL